MSKNISFRYNRWEQINKQEQLIYKKKREIEGRLKNETGLSESSNCIEKRVNQKPIVLDSNVNKFENDGSFLEKFKKLQEEAERKKNTLNNLNSSQFQSEKLGLKEDSDLIIKKRQSNFDSDIKMVKEEDKPNEEEVNARLNIEKCAIFVTMNGLEAEDKLKGHKDDNNYRRLLNPNDVNHQYYLKSFEELESAKKKEDEKKLNDTKKEKTQENKRKRESRWNDDTLEKKQTNLKDTNLVQYAMQVYGKCDLTPEQWKQLEDQRKMKILYEMMQRKRQKREKLEKIGKMKYEYDSDEEVDGGTWEHKRRVEEMEMTKEWAEKLTEMNKGKHHIGDYLPPEQLEKFMLKWESLKDCTTSSLYESDYNEFKLKSDNIGYQLLKKQGWSEGKGLGAHSSGIINPIESEGNPVEKGGLGQARPDELKQGDDEYEAYRKRMMLAYRFRPNPMNNPRRPYY